MPAHPSISVIVIAHHRRQFLEDALLSVVGQTLDRDRFEILVVKNFHDEKIDRLCAKLGARNLYSVAGPISEKVLAGYRESRGDVITILEDDDRYAPGRLRAVATEFAADLALGFFHNAVECINEKGTVVDGPLGLRMTQIRGRPTRVQEKDKSATNPRMGFSRPDFNTSSMAVSRKVMDLAVPYMDRVHLVLDSLLYYAAWASPYSLLIDPHPWTQYRFHHGNVSLGSGSGAAESTKRVEEYRTLAHEDHRVLGELAATYQRPELQRDLALLNLSFALSKALTDPRTRRKDIWALCGELREHVYPFSSSPRLLETGANLMLSLVSPKMGRSFHRRD